MAQMFMYHDFINNYQLYNIIFYSVASLLVLFLVRQVVKLRNYSKSMPSKHLEISFVAQCVSRTFFEPQGDNFNAYPITTGLLQFLTGLNVMFKKEQIFQIWAVFFHFLFINKPESIEEVLNNTKMNDKSWYYKWFHYWLNTGLLTSNGQKWKSRRKLMTPAFHFHILKDFLPIINEKCDQLIQKLKKESVKDYVDISKFITLCSLDVICETTLGLNIKAQENAESEYIKAVYRVTEVMAKRLINLFHWIDFLFFITPAGRQYRKDVNLLRKFTLNVIQEKKKEILSNRSNVTSREHKRKPLIEILLEHHLETKDLSEEDIREEVDTFTFEGHDTTSVALTWTLYLIGLYPDIQDKLYEELYQIFGSDTERPITNDDLRDMKYLECVIKESLRLYPPVPMIQRKAGEDAKINGCPLLKDEILVFFPYFIHRNEELYPNAEVFDPNRFTPENSAKRHVFSYLPFSAGSRNCIGQRFAMMELKVILTNVLRHFNLKSLDPRDILLPNFEIVLRPAKPVRIKLSPRKGEN